MIKQLLQYSFILFAFALPLSRALVNLFVILTLLLWILEGDFKSKLERIKKDKIVLIFLLIGLLTIISVLFSHSYHNSFLAGSSKSIFRVITTHYILVPLIIAIITTSIEKRVMQLAMSAFLLAIFFSELVSYLIHLHLIDLHYFQSMHLINSGATFSNPTPFMNHVEYSVFLSIAILFLLQMFLDAKNPLLKIFTFLFLTSATINLFINGGRTGQLIYILTMFTYASVYFSFSVKKIIPAFLAITIVITIAYNYSSIFHNRVNQATMNIEEISKGNLHTSWGERFASNVVTLSYLTSSAEHFIFGAGAGDSRAEYLNQAKEHFPPSYYLAIKHLAHIHNQYLEYWMDGTIFAVLLFIGYLIFMFKLQIPKKQKPLLYAFIVAVIVASSTDVPLFRYRPAMLIMFLTSYFIVLSYKEENS